MMVTVVRTDRARSRLAETLVPIAVGAARLYASAAGWRLGALPADAEELRQVLTPIFGAPLLLRRRGSVRARQAAGAVAFAGAALFAVAIVFDVARLVLVGVPALILGVAALWALS